MTTTVYRTATTILMVVVAGLVILLATRQAHADTPKPVTITHVIDQTASFNDGYSTAMQDACQQHATYACQWLKANTH